MNLLLPLILAHFLADYPLQSNWLVAYKTKKFAGIVLHSFTHVVTTILVCLPFVGSGKLWLGAAFIFVTHNFLDEGKVVLNRRHPKHLFLWYVLDQIGHLLTITGVVWAAGPIVPTLSGSWINFYTNTTLLKFVLILVLVTFFYDVTRWTWRNAKKPQPYIRDWGLMARNAILVFIAYGVYWLVK